MQIIDDDEDDTVSETREAEFDTTMRREAARNKQKIRVQGVDEKDYTTNSTQVNRRVSPTIVGTDLYKTLDEYEEFIKLDDIERNRYQ